MKSVPKASPLSSPRRPVQAMAHILAATDFSDTARLALEWAVELAQAHHARLTVIHSVDSRRPNEPHPRDQQHVRSELEELAGAIQRRNVTVDVQHEAGKPWDVIINAAASGKPDLIVLGATGHSTLREKLLGTTADRVIRLAPAPVLVVRPGNKWPRSGLHTILAAVDFSSGSLAAVSMAQQLIRSSQHTSAKLVMLHVSELDIPYPGVGSAAFDPKHWDKAEQDAQRRLNELAASLHTNGVAIETVTMRGAAGEAIIDKAVELNATLIAVGTQGHGARRFAALHKIGGTLIGSVAEHVLHNARCPVLTVAAGPTEAHS